jgi:hypothetical protein
MCLCRYSSVMGVFYVGAAGEARSADYNKICAQRILNC